MNAVNIQLFQFERDLTWMAFFMDAHDRFYARYGGREDSDAESHLTKDSMVRLMKQVLELHRTGKVQKSRFEPGPEPGRTPEQIPTMAPMMARRKDSKCIHCHDVKVAELRHLQQLGRFTRDLVFTYPAASAVGLELDPNVQNLVRAVRPNSAAQVAGIRSGDTLVSAGGQRILTFADLTRVLELTPQQADLPIEIFRAGETLPGKLALSGSWRRTEDPSWRESLHVAGPNGGFWGRKLSEDERKERGLPPGKMAVLVTFIWGEHPRQAGLKLDDVVLKFDGLTRDMTIPQLHGHLNLNRDYGDRVPMTVHRAGKELDLTLSLPKERNQEE